MKKKQLAIVAIILVLAMVFVVYERTGDDPATKTVISTVQHTSNKNTEDITVIGRTWFEAICPPGGSGECVGRVYVVDKSVMVVKPDTPKIALTNEGTLVGCAGGSSKECGGFRLDVTYKVTGTLNTTVNLGANVKVIEIKSFESINP